MQRERMPPPAPGHGPPLPMPQHPTSSSHFTSPPPRLPPHGENMFPPSFMPPPHLQPQHLLPYPSQNPVTSKSGPESYRQPSSGASFLGQGAPPLPPSFMPPSGFPSGFPPPHGFGGAPSHPPIPPQGALHPHPQGHYPPNPHLRTNNPAGPPPPVPHQGMPPPSPMSSSGVPSPVPLPFSTTQMSSDHSVQRPHFHGSPSGMVAPQVSNSSATFPGVNPSVKCENGNDVLPAVFSAPPPQSSLASYGHAAVYTPPFPSTFGPPPGYPSAHPIPPPYPIQEEPQLSAHVEGGKNDDEVQRQMDQEWTQGWLRQRRQHRKIEKPKTTSLKICDAQAALKQAQELLARLRAQRDALQETTSDDNIAWRKGKEQAEATKRELEMEMKKFHDKSVVEALKSKIADRKSKRERLKRKRQRQWEEQQLQQQEWARTEAKIDQWQNDLHQKDLDKKQEAEMKKAADSTLAEVRRKQTEAERTLDLLASVQKLRKIRKDAAERHGKMLPNAYTNDKQFDERIAKLQELIETRKIVYDGEEKTMKVMLEIEQEETKEKEREQQRIQEMKQASRQHRAHLEMLFGKTEVLDSDDEMLPFRNFYEQAQHSLESLAQIRREWDMFLVPPGTPGASSFPRTWVLPPEPSSDAWEKFLQD